MYKSSSKSDVCSYQHAFMLDNILRKLFQNPAKITGPYIKKDDVIIDIGCGPGFFSLEMARLTGSNGKVVSVDLQKEMLDIVSAKAEKKQLRHVIDLCRSSEENLNLPQKIQADFILAYYMVHETKDFNRFFNQVKPALKPEGLFLVVEPPFHVSAGQFKTIEKCAVDAGFSIEDRPSGKGGKSLLLKG